MEEARKAAEEAGRIRVEEEARIKDEEEAHLKEEVRRADEEAEREAEEEARLAEATKRMAEEAAECGRAEENARSKAEEETRVAEEIRKAEEEAERIRAEEESRRKAEDEARLLEEARRVVEEAERLKVEEAVRLEAEEEARVVEEVRRAKEEAERTRMEEELRLKAEEEACLVKETRRVVEEAERLKVEGEARLKAEEEARVAEEVRRAKEEAECIRMEEETTCKAEEEARKAEEESVFFKAEGNANHKAEEEACFAEEARKIKEEANCKRAEEETMYKVKEEVRNVLSEEDGLWCNKELREIVAEGDEKPSTPTVKGMKMEDWNFDNNAVLTGKKKWAKETSESGYSFAVTSEPMLSGAAIPASSMTPVSSPNARLTVDSMVESASRVLDASTPLISPVKNVFAEADIMVDSSLEQEVENLDEVCGAIRDEVDMVLSPMTPQEMEGSVDFLSESAGDLDDMYEEDEEEEDDEYGTLLPSEQDNKIDIECTSNGWNSSPEENRNEVPEKGDPLSSLNNTRTNQVSTDELGMKGLIAEFNEEAVGEDDAIVGGNINSKREGPVIHEAIMSRADSVIEPDLSNTDATATKGNALTGLGERDWATDGLSMISSAVSAPSFFAESFWGGSAAQPAQQPVDNLTSVVQGDQNVEETLPTTVPAVTADSSKHPNNDIASTSEINNSSPKVEEKSQNEEGKQQAIQVPHDVIERFTDQLQRMAVEHESELHAAEVRRQKEVDTLKETISKQQVQRPTNVVTSHDKCLAQMRKLEEGFNAQLVAKDEELKAMTKKNEGMNLSIDVLRRDLDETKRSANTQ